MIFAIEGIITCCLALISFLTLTDRPATAKWLTQEEKDLAIARVKSERVGTTEVLVSSIFCLPYNEAANGWALCYTGQNGHEEAAEGHLQPSHSWNSVHLPTGQCHRSGAGFLRTNNRQDNLPAQYSDLTASTLILSSPSYVHPQLIPLSLLLAAYCSTICRRRCLHGPYSVPEH